MGSSVKNKKVLEANLRSILRDTARFPSGAVSFVEFAPGGDSGIPDCWIVDRGVNPPVHKPVELKLGISVIAGLRPSQRRWHKDSLNIGARTFGLAIDLEGTVRGYELVLKDSELFEIIRIKDEQRRLCWQMLEEELFG